LRSHVNPLGSWIARAGEKFNDEDNEVSVIRTTGAGEGTGAIQAIFGSKAFQNPKPPSLIKQLVMQSTTDKSIVLDFFAGSATTAQAVMELNSEDGGDRRFIMVSSTEATTDEPDKNLCRDVTARRVRLLNASKDPKFADLSADFAYLRARRVNFEDLDYDLKPREAWAILEAMHDLPLTAFEANKPWQTHQTDALTLVYVDRCDDALLAFLTQLGEIRANAFVYAWAPGQIQQSLNGVMLDVQGVRETLVKRFQQ
jgi:adenine-specific DNA-methyltransferase